MPDQNSGSTDDEIKFIKSNYEVFEVGEKLVYSNEREKIKKYAKEKGEDHMTYKMSFNSREGAEKIAKEVK